MPRPHWPANSARPAACPAPNQAEHAIVCPTTATDGAFHTVGDIAYRDEDGFVYICDRKTDMIISGGMNVYPPEIEAALEQHPGIFDVAVFGIPSAERGEQVRATVVRRQLRAPHWAGQQRQVG